MSPSSFETPGSDGAFPYTLLQSDPPGRGKSFRHRVERVEDSGFFILEPGGGIVSWSPGAERLSCHPAGELIGGSISVGNRPEGGSEIRVYLPVEG